MKRHFQISRIKPNASMATPSVLPSGFTFVDNFQGATAAVSELSTAIETALEQMSLGVDLGLQLKQLVHGLDKEGSTYDNSKVNEQIPCSEWQCSRATAELVSLAWNCTHETYNTANDIVDPSRYSVQCEFVETPSLGEGVKAWTSTLVSPLSNSAEKSEFLPVLVVAIRGSASSMDHVVNVNEPPRDASHFIDPSVSSNPGLLANATLLKQAEALSESVSQRIQLYADARGQHPKHVLLTGHSAGGAVASLLFLHYISKSGLGKRARFSCVTFGSPPSIAGPIDVSRYHSTNSATIAVNLVNEFDLMSRADSTYAMSLVNLARSTYGQRPIPLDEGGSSSSSGTREPSPTLTRDLSASSRNVWPVPKLGCHHVGSRVVLMMRLDEDEIQLRAVEVPDSEFEKLLFCRMSVHNGVCYSERIQLIQDGIFNRRRGWTGKEVQGPINPKCL
ncbi:hypothetical protein B0T10DRAFT_484244 [Thelonectria olida]|uniref:Fungal lipase-type domain-containing protein n=1 Tax=Thelonectria olida TaxID=1576542 RepID=A0A9P8W5N9_9HYPO|nr:hypothetical protein B0T10DRAFT_484244 [Thelonectria olida]